LFGISAILILFIKPELLKSVASIKNTTKIEESLEALYQKIEAFFFENKGYLNHNYTQANISIDTGISYELVRKSIKSCSNMTVPLFINSYRIKYACQLIEQDYLQSYSMEALAEMAGFGSQVSFNRVFKKLKNSTPSEYLKAI